MNCALKMWGCKQQECSFGQGVVQKLRVKDEEGRWSRKVNYCPRFNSEKCPCGGRLMDKKWQNYVHVFIE